MFIIPSFSVTVGPTYLTIEVTKASGYYLRFFVRDTDYNTIVDTEWIPGSSNNSKYVGGLSQGTKYVCNVSYNTTASSVGAQWIGGQTVTTTTIPTYNVSFTTKGVSCDLYWYDGDNEYNTTRLYLEEDSTSFYARAKSGNSYKSGAKNIICLSGYTTPITWRYNTASGDISTTEIANGGSNSIDITTYNRTIYVYATKVPTTSTLSIEMGSNVASWVFYKTSSTTQTGTTNATISSLTVGTTYKVVFTAKNGYVFDDGTRTGSSTKTVNVIIAASGSTASSGKAVQSVYFTISRNRNKKFCF